jgi:DNA-directed RNA polymerase subunit RPC12/RpoP
MDRQADNEKQVLCNGCGKAFTAFLSEMAEHNAKVVCPHCSKVYSRDEAAALTKTSRSNTRMADR